MHTLCCVLSRTQAQVARVNAQRVSCFCQNYCYYYGLIVIQYFLLFDRLPVKQLLRLQYSLTVVDIQFSPLDLRMAPRWLYMVMVFLSLLTQLSSQLSKKISTIKNFQISSIAIQRKSHNVCYIQSCYIADTCTQRVTHFGLSSGTHARLACLFLIKQEDN